MTGGTASGKGVAGGMLTGAGTYRVMFDREISQCAFVGTPKRNSTWIAAYRQADNRSVIVVPTDAGGSVVITDFDLAGLC